MVNIEQVKEALAALRWNLEGDEPTMDAIDAERIVEDAARRFVAGWETCPTCNGEGDIAADAPKEFQLPCPDCVDGMIPGTELVERGVDGACKHHTREQTKEMVKAVLLASRRDEQ